MDPFQDFGSLADFFRGYCNQLEGLRPEHQELILASLRVAFTRAVGAVADQLEREKDALENIRGELK